MTNSPSLENATSDEHLTPKAQEAKARTRTGGFKALPFGRMGKKDWEANRIRFYNHRVYGCQAGIKALYADHIRTDHHWKTMVDKARDDGFMVKEFRFPRQRSMAAKFFEVSPEMLIAMGLPLAPFQKWFEANEHTRRELL